MKRSLIAAVLIFSFVAVAFTGCKSTKADTLTDPSIPFEYTVLEDGTVEITKYTGDEASVEVPEAIGEKTVTSIAAEAFKGCEQLTSCTLPRTVTSIGEKAFAGTSLVIADLPARLKALGAQAFFDCPKLAQVKFKRHLEVIGEKAFSGCTKLIVASFQGDVASISADAFADCAKLEFYSNNSNKNVLDFAKANGINVVAPLTAEQAATANRTTSAAKDTTEA